MDLTLLAETDHSIIWVNNKAKAVIKQLRNVLNSRTLILWHNETRALESIGIHPGITRLLSCSATDLTITLSLAPGQVLSSYDPNTLVPYASQICLQLSRALSHIHAHNHVHDDVKPDNIMLFIPSPPLSDLTELTVTLVDFGACVHQGEFTKSGTPWYVAPEFTQKVKDAKADIWALGVTMAWVLGEFPLPERSREEWILPSIWEDEAARGKMEEWLRVVEQVRDRLRAKAAGELELVIVEMLEPDFERRITANEVMKSLEAENRM